MHKYGHWRKLPITAFAVAGSLLVGCGDATYPNEDLAPEFVMVEELATEYKDRIGDAVILEGRLIVTDDGQYFLGEMMDAGQEIQGFRLALKFELDNISDDRMKRCLSGPTLVTGVLQESNEIQVKYVKLTSDTRVHQPDKCYHYSD